jgi:hypothetical protein
MAVKARNQPVLRMISQLQSHVDGESITAVISASQFMLWRTWLVSPDCAAAGPRLATTTTSSGSKPNEHQLLFRLIVLQRVVGSK